MLAIFKCDASYKLGGGHLMRCHTLARRLSDAGWDTVIATAETSSLQTFTHLSEPPAYVEFPLKDANHSDTLIKFFPNGCDLLVVDQYELDKEYESACRDWADRILVIDDLANRHHDCDWLLDATPGRDYKDYKKLISSSCRFLCGGNYALLRKEFLTLRSISLAGRTKRKARLKKRIFLSFGLTDPAGATIVALEGLARLKQDIQGEVIFSDGSPFFKQAVDLAHFIGPHVAVSGAVSDIAKRMSRADLAIGACGSTALERCCLGLPAVTVTLADNQELMAQTLQHNGAIIHLGKHDGTTPDDYARAIESIFSDEDCLLSMSRAAAGFCDGRGATRVALAVSPPESTPCGAVRLRLAELTDLWQVYQWQCQPLTRRFANNSNTPSRAEHQKWFIANLDDPDKVFTIIECAGQPAGVFRLDPVKGSSAKKVSIYVAPDHYRKGIGKAALGIASRFWPDQDFIAQVKSENVASHQLFTSAGYRQKDKNTYFLTGDRDKRSRRHYAPSYRNS